jgi:ribulose-5-phosphate 4-epimerase/fuculose-1-phosphate aldolase
MKLAKSQSGCMTNYFHKLELPKAEYDLAVYEGTYAYHTVLHNHSLCSMACATLHLQARNFPVQKQSVHQSLPKFMFLGVLKN